MHSLPVFVRLAGETVLVLGEGDAAAAKRRLVERAGGIVTDDPATSARFAFVAIDERQETDVVATMLRARGMLVNVADRPELCDFTLPAIVDRDPVIVAIGTGGSSAGLAKALRQRIEAILPTRLGELAARLFGQRSEIKTRWPDADERRRAIDAGLGEGGLIDPLSENAVDHVAAWLTGAARSDDGVHSIVVTSDDPDDLTVRSVRLLGQADEIWHQSGIAPQILNRGRADAKRGISEEAPTHVEKGRLVLWLTKA